MEDIEDIGTIGGVTKDGDHHSGRHAGYENAESHWCFRVKHSVPWRKEKYKKYKKCKLSRSY